MKATYYALLLALVLGAGCGKANHPSKETPKGTPTNATGKNNTPEKPTKKVILREMVIGEYEGKKDEGVNRLAILENGLAEWHRNGREEAGLQWKLTKEGEIHIVDKLGNIGVFGVNEDDSITFIALLDKIGNRKAPPKGNHFTAKKVK